LKPAKISFQSAGIDGLRIEGIREGPYGMDFLAESENDTVRTIWQWVQWLAPAFSWVPF
jgi:hypothetical protein